MLRPRASAGFTLIEMVIAITILAIIALISWRSLDGIIRGQHRLTESLEETRAIDRLFEQLQTDFGEAVRDDDLGQPTVVFGDGDLRIVRMLRDARQPIRWLAWTVARSSAKLQRRSTNAAPHAKR
ncbi:MAG: prepilin-type N-terminal cleavage/methylation domain-containing protein [Betaproteobacteria bacterium]|nr:prepilin-type N-terminal cleavage/methylation domain-containing protein [Betaproteobacteria bacterium]